MVDFTSINTYLVILISYFLGCFPSAFLLTKIFFNINILKAGTGNVGAMNSYDITRKKWVGIAVFILDALKAVLALYITAEISGQNQNLLAFSSFFIILGHNFNIFLGFKGGRGLASASAISIVINYIAVSLWCVIWCFVYFLLRRNVHIANIIATLWSTIIIFLMPLNLINLFSSFYFVDAEIFKNMLLLISALIFIRHTKPLIEYYKKDENKNT